MHRDRGRTPSKRLSGHPIPALRNPRELAYRDVRRQDEGLYGIEDALRDRDPWHGFRVYIKRVYVMQAMTEDSPT
jgi:hypothetical protein